MFGFRADGKKVKGQDGLTRMASLFMPRREGGTNYIKFQIEAKFFDDFIAAKKQEGLDYNYRDIIIATLVRMHKIWPRLNRFITAGQTYQRNHIDVCLMAHKSLRTGDDETAVKVRFTGYETIAEIKANLDAKIETAVKATNNTDALTDLFAKVPLWFLKFVVGTLRFGDHFGIWSDKFLFETSPMHCSIFMTDMKSIKMDYVFHHLYNFGNCGFFFSMGKEKIEPYVNSEGKLVAEKLIDFGISVDERFTDGLYYSHVIKSIKRTLQNLSCLERPLEEYEIHRLKTYKEIKLDRKKKKKNKKTAKKQEKQNKKLAKKNTNTKTA